MKRSSFSSILFLALTVPSALACEGPPICTVIDPTDTPLNVRQGPNGDILSTLRDGVKVEVIEHQEHDGQRWALIAHYGADWGYVFGDYLVCQGEDDYGDGLHRRRSNGHAAQRPRGAERHDPWHLGERRPGPAL